MCGISGLISLTPQPSALIVSMTDAVRHRGPDDEGYVLFSQETGTSCVAGGVDTPAECFDSRFPCAPRHKIQDANQFHANVMLGHRRLAILDVSTAGHQPMCTPGEEYWIVYNGEIYNYLELKYELEKHGVEFSSHTDTEVILAAYKQWGKECLQRFNGMFAFLIFDKKRNTIFAARDRFGVKPLYYWVSGSFIAFASEIKQFIGLPGWTAKINGQRVYDYLNWGIIDHTADTLYHGVYQLRGGEAIELDLKDMEFGNKVRDSQPVNSYRWYKLEPGGFDGSYDEAAGRFRELLTDSVSLCLRSDVPVGSCLSGGLDSSSVVCLIGSLLNNDKSDNRQKTFSACSDIKVFDERDYIEDVVAHTGVDAHYVYPPLEKLFEDNDEITWHQDGPYGSTSIYAQWNVFKLAKQNNIKVMLDGQGADEQLAGYQSFFAARLAGLFKSARLITLFKEIQQTRKNHGHSTGNQLMSMANMILPDALRKVALSCTKKGTPVSPEWVNMGAIGARPVDPTRFINGKMDSIQSYSYALLTAMNLQMLLHWEDRDSMAHSIEARVPFLDYRLVEFVLGLPDQYKLSGGITKKIMRTGMEGILPDRVRNRMDKLSFATPEQVWVTQHQPDLFKQHIEEALDISGRLFRKEAKDIAFSVIDGQRPFSNLPWRIISFGSWVKKFNVSV